MADPALRPFSLYGKPVLASNGRAFVAAWSDWRNGNQDTLATRIDENGHVIDIGAFPLLATWRDDFDPVLLWNGTDYAGFVPTQGLGTFLVRLSSTGEVNAGGEPLANDGTAVSGAWNGSRYAVAFLGRNSLVLSLFDADLRSAGSVAVSESTDLPISAVVVSDGRDFVVAWKVLRAERDVLFARAFDDTGVAHSAAIELASVAREPGWGSNPDHPTGLDPAAVWNGSEYLVVWSGADGIRGRWVASDGAPERELVLNADALPNTVSIAWDGMNYLITWMSQIGEEGALIARTGDVVERLHFTDDTHGPATVVSNGSSFLVVAGNATYTVRSPARQRLTATGPLTKAYLSQSVAAITASDNELLTAWAEGQVVYASRMNARGEPLDGSGVRLGAGGYQNDPIVAASAHHTHIVGWGDPMQRAHIARVTEDGRVLDGDSIVVAEHASTPVVASNGEEFLAVFQPLGANGTAMTAPLVAVLVPQNGTAIRTMTLQSDVYANARLDALLPLRDGYALVWQKPLTPPCFKLCTSFEEHLSLIDAAGKVTADHAFAFAGTFLAASPSGDNVMLATLRDQSIVIQTIGPDGTELTDARTPSSQLRGTGARLVTRPGGGHMLLYTSYTPAIPPEPWWHAAVQAILIEPDGTPSVEVSVADATTLSDAVPAFGTVWMTYGVRWFPQPNAHDGSVGRAFIKDVGTRRRAASAH